MLAEDRCSFTGARSRFRPGFSLDAGSILFYVGQHQAETQQALSLCPFPIMFPPIEQTKQGFEQDHSDILRQPYVVTDLVLSKTLPSHR